MADKTLGIVRRVMNWHASRSDDFRSPIVKGMARTNPKERARERILTDDEIRVLWRTSEGVFGRFMQFLLLTGARRGEAAQMERSELAEGDWTLPAARNKTKVDLVRPLSLTASRNFPADVSRDWSCAAWTSRQFADESCDQSPAHGCD
jgi:integrase